MFVSIFDICDKSVVFRFFVTENGIIIIETSDWTVGRDGDNTHVVNLAELFLFGLCSTGHTGKLIVETEEVLIGDGGESDSLRFDGDVFLGLERLLETIGVFSTFHDTAGETID